MNLLLALVLSVLFPVWSAGAEYAPAETAAVVPADLQGEALFDYLHELTGRNNHISPQKTTAKYMYSTADNIEFNGVRGVLTAYSQVFVPGTSQDGKDYPEQGDANGDGHVDTYVNVEHSWPQHYFNGKMPMAGDIHHLQTTFMTPNSMRGHLPYCKVSNPDYTTRSGSRRNKSCFEPCDANKGNTARAILYFIVRYYDKITVPAYEHAAFWKDNVQTLLEWNQRDLPDDNERRRNDLAEKFQGNRNPFIDDPSLAERIGSEVLKSY